MAAVCSKSASARPAYASVSRAFSRTRRSSERTHGGRMIEPKSPARMRACWPTITFSSAVIVGKRRMFWKVRAIPIAMIRSGRACEISRSPKAIRPELGR